jgi:uncharacterized protein (DUF2252 family)
VKLKQPARTVQPDSRAAVLLQTQNLKMAESPHRYVRGSTVSFYRWLEGVVPGSLPTGPMIWICGDCHVGNLGPLANASGGIEIQIRDLDQTVIGNPAHDLVRLGLSLASAARGSDLPGVATALMLERMMDGYEKAFQPDFSEETDLELPQSIRASIRQSAAATWKSLAYERIDDPSPTIPLGRRYWPLSDREKKAIEDLFSHDSIRNLATILKSRDDDAQVDILDAAYWMKGCSSLGLLRYAVLLSVRSKKGKRRNFCLMDIKEAMNAAAPRAADAEMPTDQAERVLEGARHLAPYLGKRMRTSSMLGKSVFLRELLPQDLKLEIDHLTRDEAVKVAEYLAAVVGKAHSRQMDIESRKSWLAELNKNRTGTLDAPTWLWRSIVDLLGIHERAYLEHCRRYALEHEIRP